MYGELRIVSVDGILFLFVPMGDLHMHACFGVVDNLAVDVLLETFFIDGNNRGIIIF